jgi:hypothetical protein
MYFQDFPLTYYSLYDDLSNVKVVTNITARVKLSDEVKDNLSLFDEYDIKDEDTPEILADRFYNNPMLHWVILHTNEILDARFDWPLSTHNLRKYVEGKYGGNLNAIHHYEDTNGVQVNGNVYIVSSSGFENFYVGNVITNTSNNGTAVVTEKVSSSNIRILVSEGGFVTSNQVENAGNTLANCILTATNTVSGIPVTNLNYEDSVNESKRRIKILKARYVDGVVKDFKKQLEL